MPKPKSKNQGRASASLETKRKAIAELQLRRASGVSCQDIGEKYGVATTSVYNWAAQDARGELGEPKKPGRAAVGDWDPPNEKPPRKLKLDAVPLEKRAEILAAWAKKAPAQSKSGFAAQHGIAKATLMRWLAKEDALKPNPQVELLMTDEDADAEAARRQYPLALKQRVVEEYTTRRAGVHCRDIAVKHGLTEAIVMSWARATRNGTLPPLQAGNGTTIVQRSQGNGHELAAVELEGVSLNGLASMRLAQLEAQNKVLRKIVQQLMDGANQGDLKRINMMLLEQL